MANPADSTPSTVDHEFDPMEFWIRNSSKILLLAGLIIAAVLIYSLYEFNERRTHNAAAQMFATAKTTDDFRKVIAEYPNSSAAANAHLLLADQLRKDGKLDESNQALRDFISKFPENNLISGAYTSLATNLESQGKLDEAVSNYQKVTTSYPTSFSAPVAWLSLGRIFKAQGKTDDAKRAFETVITQFPESAFAAEANRQNAQLKK
ncbi:tetratricopeptide repeat protein [Verrucomicrobiota bacterium sgz303538]